MSKYQTVLADRRPRLCGQQDLPIGAADAELQRPAQNFARYGRDRRLRIDDNRASRTSLGGNGEHEY